MPPLHAHCAFVRVAIGALAHLGALAAVECRTDHGLRRRRRGRRGDDPFRRGQLFARIRDITVDGGDGVVDRPIHHKATRQLVPELVAEPVKHAKDVSGAASLEPLQHSADPFFHEGRSKGIHVLDWRL